MSKPNIRPIPGQQRPLTEEEKKVKIMQFLQQKRETIAVNVLCSLCHNLEQIRVNDMDAVDVAVAFADKLIEKLYPLPEEDKANQ